MRILLILKSCPQLSLLIKHAQWSQDHEQDGRAAAAIRFASSGIDRARANACSCSLLLRLSLRGDLEGCFVSARPS
jgi:hypothetical protein